jgi:hypothetical protein
MVFMAEQWKKMLDVEKQEWNDMYTVDRQRYNEQMAQWKLTGAFDSHNVRIQFTVEDNMHDSSSSSPSSQSRSHSSNDAVSSEDENEPKKKRKLSLIDRRQFDCEKQDQGQNLIRKPMHSKLTNATTGINSKQDDARLLLEAVFSFQGTCVDQHHFDAV